MKRALKRPGDNEDHANKEDGQLNVGDPKTPVVFWIIDPDDLSHKDSNGYL